MDNQIMEKVRQNDKEAYEKIVVKHRKPAIQFANTYVKNREDAEDIVQECFVKIYINRMSYNTNYTFKTYLYTLIRNQCIDMIRKKQVKKTKETYLEADFYMQETPEKIMLSKEKREYFLMILNELNKEYGIALYLYTYEELSYKEIGKIMGKTTGQIKITIYRARKKIKKRYKGGEMDEI
jgi:RNA polymerase sigma factor, sigma-70 family